MSQYVYSMQKVGKIVPPKKQILRDISLYFLPGAKIGVLGYNGAGKSTLLRIMAGVDTEIIGEARPQPGIKIGYLSQEPKLDESLTVRDEVEKGVGETKALLDRFNAVSEAMADPEADFEKLMEEQGELQEKIEACDAWDLDRQLDQAAAALNLPDWGAAIKNLSGGERRRVALCKLLLEKPDMLLLDEPTNHLDAESVDWLEKFLHDFPGTVVAVTHDRYFLDNVAGWILELDRGHGIPWEGNYSSWLDQKDKRLAQEEKAEAAHKKAIAAELEWVRANPKGRQSKSKARLKQFEELSSQEFQKRSETNEIYIPVGQRLGDKVVEVKSISKRFGDRTLYEDVSFSVPRGAVVGIVGANGAGKSTLFRMLTGAEQPDAGSIELGETVQISYVDQSRDALDGRKTVWEEISDGQDILRVGGYEIPSRAYVGRFNFKGNDQQKRIGDLSGGERNRVHLAKLLQSGDNLLLLDEPTNDLDVETLRALEDAVLNFAGSAMVISHDRWFLDRIATHILAFEDDGEVVYHEGNWQDYAEDHKKRKGADAGINARAKHRKLAG